MTTLAELKVTLARDLSDTAGTVFNSTDLESFLNKAIAEVSRVAPQQFVEDVNFYDGQLAYVLRGGQGNLVANPSFEEGSASLVGASSAVEVLAADVPDETNGWLLAEAASAGIYFPRDATRRKTGLYVGAFKPIVASLNAALYQDIPVNPDTVYAFSAWHSKLVTGGLISRIRVDTLDVSSVVVDVGVIQHDTTSSTMVQASGTVTIPSSGVSFLRVSLTLIGTQPGTQEVTFMEDVTLIEQGEQTLVSTTARTAIEVSRVEVWDATSEPESFVSVVVSGRSAVVSSSEGGWRFWAGTLYIPNWLEARLVAGTHFLRVFGYAPYDRLVTDAQVADLSDELEFAVLFRAFVEGIRRLTQSRALFTQWQTRNNNTDVSVASLQSDLSNHLQEWRVMKRELVALRER